MFFAFSIFCRNDSFQVKIDGNSQSKGFVLLDSLYLGWCGAILNFGTNIRTVWYVGSALAEEGGVVGHEGRGVLEVDPVRQVVLLLLLFHSPRVRMCHPSQNVFAIFKTVKPK